MRISHPLRTRNTSRGLVRRARTCILWGILDGDIDAQLNAVSAKLVPGQPLEVDCSLLVRLDFVAAGSLLNWAAQAQSQGVALRFTHLHHLVAAFMTVLGVQEHAKLYLSPV